MGLKEKIRFRKKPGKLKGIDVLYIQVAIQQERNLRTLSEILLHFPLKEIEGYWKEMHNGDIQKRKYYENAKQTIGKKPDLKVLRRNLLNYENKAYIEFLEKYK